MRLESWGAGGENELAGGKRLAPAQPPADPPRAILKARAEELAPGCIRFNHELLSLEQDEAGVTALIRDNGTGDEYPVRCQYMIGADGGRRVAGEIGSSTRGWE